MSEPSKTSEAAQPPVEERMSLQTFANDLGTLIRRYLLTFDPAAPTKLQLIRLQVSGENLGLIYAEQGGQPPSLSVSLSQLERPSDLDPIEYPMVDPTADDPRKGWRK
jgi:hypothetical protein